MTQARRTDYAGMLRALVRRMLLVSVLPLAVIATANFLLFYTLNRSIVEEQHSTLLRYHKESIEAFLDSLTAEVSALANQYTLAELSGGDLERIFPVIQQSDRVFIDIGIIDSRGHHVTYVGPYDLSDRNYSEAPWFAEVVARGSFVSDMFLGYRGIPHFIIAVKRKEGEDFWILRATVNTDYFSRLVDAAHLGRTGETFIVNREGLLQTRTRFESRLLESSGMPDLLHHEGILVRPLTMSGARYLCTTAWLGRPSWLLVYRQQVSEAFAPLRHAVVVGLLMTSVGVLGAAFLALMAGRAQVRKLKRADAEKEALTQRLVATGKTAALGEMSAGLAHEINNPLATIDTLQTWISDLASSEPINSEDRLEILDSAAKIGAQVDRCKAITQGLLKFARRVDSVPEPLDILEILTELVTVMRARARVEGVELAADLQPVAPVLASAAQVQQIFMNLVNNAVDATAGHREAQVRLTTSMQEGAVRVQVSDNGCGIDQDNLSSIFLPFFTTKAVGKGTGLGLAICYGLVQDLGGTIEVDSIPDHGTCFTVTLPPAAHEIQRP